MEMMNEFDFSDGLSWKAGFCYRLYVSHLFFVPVVYFQCTWVCASFLVRHLLMYPYFPIRKKNLQMQQYYNQKKETIPAGHMWTL